MSAAGLNSNGQLGDNSTTQRTTPVQVKVNATDPLTGVSAIAAGLSFSLALKSDGTCWSWGLNANGQLGNNSTTQSIVAVQVLTSGGSAALTGITAIAAGDTHALAVKSDGSIWAWGNNGSGRLGDGTTTQRLTAVAVTFSGSPVLTMVAAGASHSMARKSDGTLWAWGSNGQGRLGDGTTDPQQLTPVQVVGLTAVTTMSAGKSHSIAVELDGSVYAWGTNFVGQLGTGTTTESPLPGLVTGITNAISVVAAADHTLAVSSDGIVWAFGKNDNGQLGDGTTETRLSPVAISEANFAWKVGTPYFSPASGTFTTTKSVTIASATGGATIRYTTDGSTPTASSTQYTGAVSVLVSTALKARAFLTSKPDSNVGTADYELKVAALSMTPASGTYSTPQAPIMSTTTSGATIRYTTDGSEPTETSAVYPPSPTVDATLTLKAKAFKEGWTPCDTVARTYTMKVGAPSLNPAGGNYASAQQVTLSTVTPGATLHYTTNGLEPAETDPIVVSGNTILVDHSQTLKVAGGKAGWVASDTTTGNYFLNLGSVANPALTPAGGTFTSSQQLTLSTATQGAIIRFTLDGSNPTPQSPIFGAPFTLSGTTTVTAQAFKNDMTPSAVVSASYTINLGAVETPTLSVPAGSYTTAKTVTISCPTAGATIHYTTNGAEPTTSDTVIASGGTLNVDKAMIVKVKAFHATLPASATVRRDYVITGAIAAGGYHSLALKTDATVWGFGKNLNGQLGDGTTTNRLNPVQVSGLSGVSAIAAGTNHSLALTGSALMSWGLNSNGQLGDGSVDQKTSPVAVTGLGSNVIVAVAAGTSHSLALTSTGTVFAWGLNTSGQLGIGSATPTQSTTPVQVVSLSGVIAIAAHADHSLALKSDGTLIGWGANAQGQLGDGTNVSPRRSPVTVLGPSGITRLAAGDNFSLALKTGGLGPGVLWNFGYNGLGQLGDGTANSRNTPLSGASEVVALEAGDYHTLVTTLDGTVWVWGGNANGQSGDGTTMARYLPTRSSGVPEGLTVDGGVNHSLALLANGGIWAWGGNGFGQLGNGTSGNSKPSPAVVPGLVIAANTWLASDHDQDDLSNATEYRLGTDPLNPDSNSNGIPDGAEFQFSGRPFDPDTDGDGLTNVDEIAMGTDPLLADSDGDGALDGADAFPLDATRWQAVADPDDHTPPVITLQEPTNATPLP